MKKYVSVECKYCGSILSSKKALNMHEKTAIYCINRRLDKLKSINEELYPILHEHYYRSILKYESKN